MTLARTDLVGRVLRAHWFCIAPLIPFAAMFALHRGLGLSDAIGGFPAGERPPAPVEIAYNYCMVGAFHAGVLGYFVFSAARAIVDVQANVSVQSDMHRRTGVTLGIAIFVAKVVLLGIGWYAFLAVLRA